MALTLSTNRDTVYENAVTIGYSATFSIEGENPRNYSYFGEIGG